MEWVRAWIAMFVVFFGLSAIVVGWFVHGIAETERAAAILLGVIGTVMGYHFGQRGTALAQELGARPTPSGGLWRRGEVRGVQD